MLRFCWGIIVFLLSDLLRPKIRQTKETTPMTSEFDDEPKDQGGISP
jgi:hypothetical protein